MRRRAIPTQSISNVESSIGHGLVIPIVFAKRWKLVCGQIRTQRAYVIRVLAVRFRTAGKEGTEVGAHTLVGRRSALRDEELATAAPLDSPRLSSPLGKRPRDVRCGGGGREPPGPDCLFCFHVQQGGPTTKPCSQGDEDKPPFTCAY
jgi:hypothetical protein